MITLTQEGVFLSTDAQVVSVDSAMTAQYQQNTLTYQILQSHNRSGNMENLQLVFDALVSPDNNYVSILQTAAACGVKQFPVPYVLSNCHNSLCAVGGTINEDDHVFGLDNAKKFGGIFIPPYKAVIHQYMREMMAGGGKMILGSDSHTRYGALGTLAIGEGGGEVAKQLLSQTYDVVRPPVLAVRLTGKPRAGIGPMDVALTLIGATFQNGFTKNKILEFTGDGVSNLSVEFRMGIDVMTTESAALSSIWPTDDKVEAYLANHGRAADFKALHTTDTAYYDGMITIDLSTVDSMMAMPYHPSNVVTIHEFNANAEKYLAEIEAQGNVIKKQGGFSILDKLHNGKLHVDQALVSGCAGGLFENLAAMGDILGDTVVTGDAPALGINPASQPVLKELARNGVLEKLISVGATVRPCICGPCFGVTDVPANNQISIRHVTRNYPNREGSKPNNGQMAAAFLMDARSIAATVRNGGYITAATDFDVAYKDYDYQYDIGYYESQVFDQYDHADAHIQIRKGANIEDWPTFHKMNQHLLLQVSGAYDAPVTTDDLSPSGDAVAFRSNPTKLAEFTMINKDVGYVSRAKAILSQETARRDGSTLDGDCNAVVADVCTKLGCTPADLTIASVMTGNQIGDGSSREQAASSQKILGGYADIACEFATKRYRSNLINWGILPVISKEATVFAQGDYLLIPNVHDVIANAGEDFAIEILGKNQMVTGNIGAMTADEKEILGLGCLINYNKALLQK